MGGILSNLTDGLLGNSKKALLIVQRPPSDNRPLGAQSLAESFSKKLKSATGLNISSIGRDECVMSVQYNPASITFQTTASKRPFKRLLNEMDSNVVAQDVRPPSTTMTVVLMFDEMNSKDAFMEEKLRIPTNIGESATAISAIIKSATGDNYSVQKQTNALVSLPLRDFTKTVTFRWANLSFTGNVSQAQARYTMFSVSGRPIRSEVTLTIVQKLDNVADVAYWNSAFDRCFKDELSGSGGAKSVSESIGSMINLSGF